MSRFPEFDRSVLRDAVRPRIADLAFAAEKANFASEFYRRLVKWINDFDSTLDQEHEVGVRLVSFGQTVVFHLDDMSYWNPSLISFQGTTEDGQPVELIQHVSQISILLMKLRRPDLSQPKKKIGFVTETDETENS
jgi:hypothetical protein